jgi:F5/8 type C domain
LKHGTRIRRIRGAVLPEGDISQCSTTSTGFIRHSFGYALPHRGVTRNDGTGNIGFSRMTDGDESTYWKSNPYLISHYKGEEDALHPQWVILDLSREELVDTLRISWAESYATEYVVQYRTGVDPLRFPTRGAWVTLPHGVTGGHGGAATNTLSELPVRLRYLRI